MTERWMRWAVIAPIAVAAAALAVQPIYGYEPGKAGFAVRVRGEVSPYATLGVYVLPDEVLAVEVLEKAGEFAFDTTAGGKVVDCGPRRLRWKAPSEPGLVRLHVERRGTKEVMDLHVFVMIPITKLQDEKLNGYRVGAYPAKPLRGLAAYRPPRGFVEVTPENADVKVSPHFKLRQFLCKQAGDYPKVVVLRERLLLKLEHLLELVNDKGHEAETFAVLSGFRTPFYNHAIGNVKYSRHQWGGAADIFIDTDGDDMMDDLNEDGKIDVQDALLLYELFDKQAGKQEYESFVGGLGLYRKTPAHGPFVHVDARGFRARWGR